MIASLEKDFAEFEMLRKQTISGLSNLSESQLAFKPDENTWSINQILEHLYLSEKATYEYMKKKMSGGEPLYTSTFKHKWRSFLLKLFLRSSKKFKLPKSAPIDPTGKLSNKEIMEQWDVLRKDFASFLDTFDEAAAQKLSFKHPRAGYFNAIQTIRFSYEHFHHHLRQIDAAKTVAQ